MHIIPGMICLHPITALPAWRLASTGAIPMPEPNDACDLLEADAHTGALADLPTLLTEQEGKVHLMVTEQAERQHSSHSVCHLGPSNEFPRGSFATLGENIQLPTPELCFALLGKQEPLPSLMRLGMELCGHYRKAADGTRYFRDPLVTAERLNSYLEELPSIRGIRGARAAASYVLDDSYSPRESVIALMCTLPTRVGGYQLPKPTMNMPLSLNDDAQLIAGQRHAAGDLYWEEQGLIVEYDGDEAHMYRRAHDVERRDGLEKMGLRVISITTAQARDFERLDAVLRMVGDQFRSRKRAVSPGVTKKRRDLYEQLVKYNWLAC